MNYRDIKHICIGWILASFFYMLVTHFVFKLI
jgi:hypothetical protein